MAWGALVKVASSSIVKSGSKGALANVGRSALKGTARAGARTGMRNVASSIGKPRPQKISKEPIWSSGTTASGEYLSSGDRIAAFRASKRKINASSSALAPIQKSGAKIGAGSSPFASKEPDIADSLDLAVRENDSDSAQDNNLEKRVANNEQKISTIKRILQIRKNDQSLAEVNSILKDIGNALSLDFANRITQEKAEIASMRAGTDSSRRTEAESSVESVKKISSTVGKAFDKVTKPVQGIFSKIFGFFGTLAKGWLANKALKWLSNNKGKVQGFFNFLEKHGSKLIIPGLLGTIFGPQLLLSKAMKTLMPKKTPPLGGLSKKAKLKMNKTMRRYIRRHGLKKAQQRFGKDAVKGLGGKFARGGLTNLARKGVTGALGKGGTKQLLKFAKKFISPVVKKIPLIGALIDFALNVFVFKEPIGKAAFKAIGAGLGLWLGGLIGTLIPIPFVGTALGGWLGGMGGDALGGAIYDMIFGNKPTGKGGDKDAEVEGVVSEYTDVANQASKMDFSKDVQSTDLTPPEEGDTTTVMDTVKLGDRADAAVNGGNVGGESTPNVGSEDLSNTYTEFTKEQVGITD